MNEELASTLATHRQELRRGTLVVACLLACRTPRYGYALLEYLASAGLDAEANTLYPLLRRLEGQGLLKAEWNTEEPRPRKYYSLTENGAEMAGELRDEWTRLTASMATLWKESPR
ncbi:PadR family transcriptional regulator [Citricoccus zhacaiensis]|uniref:PadR family transcriptional regulator n=1 Tax=Citricoccus zhacaiensis TaxID=489142 RepID=A0ABQ2LT32_9MICC|nr:PadR family transcriptional regulator [Citricoccus zhacaiensis]GGO42846.1 PadR family transcriptional regulator [Citricoccus zhacaiensis]